MHKKCENCGCGDKQMPTELTDSLWIASGQTPSYPPLAENTTADTVIIGGGITGLTAAYLLQQAGQKVAVVEAAQIGRGVTGYTTAHITVALDTKYQDFMRTFGEATTKLIAQTSRDAITTITNIVQTEHIDCDLETVDGYLYTENNPEHIDMLQKEASTMQQVGIAAEYTTDIPLPFPTKGGVKIPNQAQFHPIKYISALAGIITKRGGRIFENSRVDAITKDAVHVGNLRIQAKQIIMATHTPITTNLLTVQAKLQSLRSYVVGVTLTQDSALPHGLFWDTAEPYHYTRTYKNTAIIGGADHPSGTNINTRAKIASVEKYACSRFPVKSVDYIWSAQLFHPADNLPYIGRAPFYRNIYVATGYAGNGLTFGTAAASIISNLILGKQDARAAIYKPGRITLASLAALTKLGINNARHTIIDRLTKAPSDTPASIPAGEGRIIQFQGKKTAVFKDDSGTVTLLSPICTHAGCTVQWNNGEKTWDCPCHGGRYHPDGKVLSGPPIKDLAKIS